MNAGKPMSLTADKFNDHVRSIALSTRAKGKAVILCEGDIESVKNVGVNPSMYRRLEKMPDANFYKACLPKEARTYRTPVFYPCGSREDVIKVFFRLRSLSAEEETYIDNNKLFAIVDLDIQKAIIKDYGFSNTEEIFFDLYNGLEINHANKERHAIFVTGLIHKEAYFLLHELQDLFDSYGNNVLRSGNNIDLGALYKEIIGDSPLDQDLICNFKTVLNRLSFLNLSASNVPDLCSSVTSEYQDKSDFAKIIFLFRKAKPYWESVHTDSRLSFDDERFREQLSLEIAKFYSSENNNDFHLTAILKCIYKQAYGIEIE